MGEIVILWERFEKENWFGFSAFVLIVCVYQSCSAHVMGEHFTSHVQPM